MGIFEKFKLGFKKSASNFTSGLKDIITKKEIDDKTLSKVEDYLIYSDVGVEAAADIKDIIAQEKIDPRKNIMEEINIILKNYIVSLMKPLENENFFNNKEKLNAVLISGVNGVGKTTTIGKIAAQYRQQGKKVLMGAGDTFRAAAIEQLVEWSRRADCDIIQKESGSDPSAVMYETVQKGIDEDYDVVICDTAGRLHTKKNLMEELKKMVRVIRKLIPDAPHEILLVLDATTGQNAIFQTREFMEATDLTGLIITKLDGTSKGGVVIGIVNEFDIPVRYIGVGEQVEDLRPFDAQQFTESIFA